MTVTSSRRCARSGRSRWNRPAHHDSRPALLEGADAAAFLACYGATVNGIETFALPIVPVTVPIPAFAWLTMRRPASTPPAA